MLRFRPWAQKQSKYNSKKTVVDGITFDSKKEAKYYCDLKVLRQKGEVLMFLRQVPFHLPGGITYRVDFQIFWAKGEVEFVDTKGFKTQEYIIKKKLVETHYPVTIKEV